MHRPGNWLRHHDLENVTLLDNAAWKCWFVLFCVSLVVKGWGKSLSQPSLCGVTRCFCLLLEALRDNLNDDSKRNCAWGKIQNDKEIKFSFWRLDVRFLCVTCCLPHYYLCAVKIEISKLLTECHMFIAMNVMSIWFLIETLSYNSWSFFFFFELLSLFQLAILWYSQAKMFITHWNWKV